MRPRPRPCASAQPARRTAHPRTRLCVRASAQPTTSAQPATLTPDQAQQWSACRDALLARGCTEEESDTLLCRAFGWAGQVYWRGTKEEQPPTLAEVQAGLDLLESIGIQGDNLLKLLRAFPEALGCGVDTILRPNVDVLQSQWKLKGPVLVKTLLRRPDVLGYNLDCEGSCVGECERCWARF